MYQWSSHVRTLAHGIAADNCRGFAIFVMMLSEVFSYLDSLMSRQLFSTDLVLPFGFPISCLAVELINRYLPWSLTAWLNPGPASCVWRAMGN